MNISGKTIEINDLNDGGSRTTKPISPETQGNVVIQFKCEKQTDSIPAIDPISSMCYRYSYWWPGHIRIENLTD